MKAFTQQRLAVLGCAILGVATLGACSSARDGSSDTSSIATMLKEVSANTPDAQSGSADPCTLLSAAEASRYVGDLETPQYRANDDGPSVRGDACVYRGRDGRGVQIKVGAGGDVVGSVMQDLPKKLGAALSKGGATGMDTMTNRVMQQGPAGPWDKATWIPGGSLFVTKGDAMVVIDMSGASGKQTDALDIARIVVPRIGHPLSYNGAKAVALVPKPPAHPSNVCDFVSRAAVEGAIGTLSTSPAPDSTGSTCTYTVETSHGTRQYPVSYEWTGGGRSFNMMKHSMSMISGILKTPGSSVLDTLKPTGQMGEMLGGLMKVVSGGSMTTAPGAAATVGLRTDTTLTGPWDHAMLYHGTQLMAVRHDAMVYISLQSADYEHAKALLGVISSKL